MKLKQKNIVKLIIALLAPQLAGGIGAIFTASAISGWYAALQRPAFSPPNWVFGPYTLLVSFAAYLNYAIWALNK